MSFKMGNYSRDVKNWDTKLHVAECYNQLLQLRGGTTIFVFVFSLSTF